MRTLVKALFVCLLLVIAAPQSTSIALAGNNQSTASAIKEFIFSGRATLGKREDDQRLFQIFTYYEERNFKPIWTRDNGVKSKAKDLLKLLQNAAEHGLNPAFYNIGDIEERITSENPEVLAELDLILSDTFSQYASDLSSGRVVPSEINRRLHIKPTGPGPLYLIDGAEAADNIAPYVDTLKPQTPRYDRVVKKLKEYRALAANGGWPLVPKGQTLKPGMDDPRIPTLRKMLVIMGDLKPGGDMESTVYDDALVAAVKSFQYRHGRTEDGIVGPSTLAAMNVPIEKRIETLALNLERRRWMADDLGDFHVFVNQADQFLKVVKNRDTIHTALLVVGKTYHQTPVFSEKMSYIVINPYWNVPSSIARNEYLPKLKRDPGSLQRQGIRLISSSGAEISPYSINWAGRTSVPYRLRQDTGSRNALGRIKFMFPNRFNVYIHDTPSKSLFAKENRYFSHGCMRVQHPADLATVLLQGQGWTKAKINAQINSNKRRIVRLKEKIPVHVTYLTAWVNKDGSAHFRRDTYGRDKILARALKDSAN